MKVLVVVYKFGTVEEIGQSLGAYAYFLRQLKEMQSQGVELVVLAPWVSWFEKGSSEVEGIRVIRYWPKLATRSLRNLLLYKLINKLYLKKTGQMVKKVAEHEKVDLVYIRQARETGAAVAQIKDQLRVPVVFQPVTTWQWHFKDSRDSKLRQLIKDTKKQKHYAKKLLAKLDHFITYNKAMKQEYVLLGASPEKFFIIPGAVDHELFRPQAELRQERTVLYIGRINFAEKGLSYLLTAFSKVAEKVKDSKLMIIGPGTETEVEKLNHEIDKLSLNQVVKYFGRKTYHELPQYINTASVGVVPSIWFESSGRASLDMLSCGLPVIVTDVGGLPEYSEDKVTGFIIPPKNSEILAERIEQILTDDNLQQTLSENARKRVLENYTFAATTKKFIKVFSQIIKQD